jgi:hypothetical protein
MSLINDALNKAQREREKPRGATLYRTPGYRPPFHAPVRVKSLAFIWVNAAVVAALFAGSLWYLRFRPAAAIVAPKAIAARPATTPVDATPAEVASTEPAALPSAPARESSTPAPLAAPVPRASAPGGYELTGMSAMGATTLLSVIRLSDKRSFWVPVGKTVGEITAISYDPASDRAVIRVNGSLQTIALRDVGSSAPAPAATPAE